MDIIADFVAAQYLLNTLISHKISKGSNLHAC
jgi:hypothetical protein